MGWKLKTQTSVVGVTQVLSYWVQTTVSLSKILHLVLTMAAAAVAAASLEFFFLNMSFSQRDITEFPKSN